MLSHRKCDKVESVEKAADTKRTSGDAMKLEQSFLDMKKQLEGFLELQMKNMAQCQVDIADSKTEIENIFKDAIKYLESLRDQALKDVVAVEKLSIPDFEAEIQESKCKISAIEYDIKLIHTNSDYGALAQFLQTMDQLSEQREMLEKFLKEKGESLTSISIEYEANNSILEIMTSLPSLCSISVNRKDMRLGKHDEIVPLVSIVDLFRADLEQDVQTGDAVTGAAVLEDSRLLITKNRKKHAKSLELWDVNNRKLSSLSLPHFPWGLKMTSPTMGGVVIYDTALLFFEINNDSIRKVKEIEVPVRRDFIFHKGRYYIGSSKKIIVQDSSHQHVYDIAVAGDVGYIAARDMNSLCYTEYSISVIHCITLDGKSVFKYSHDKLQGTRGVTVDCDGNIYVCGYHSKNVHQLNRDGKLQRIMFDNLPANPYFISFSHDYGKAVIGCNGRVLLYKLS